MVSFYAAISVFHNSKQRVKKKKKNTLTVYRSIYAVLYIHKRREKGIMFLVGEKIGGFFSSRKLSRVQIWNLNCNDRKGNK